MKAHFEDKILRCSCCDKDVRIPHNQVGGFWWLNGYDGSDGKKHSGGYCPPCFNRISK